MKKRILHTIIGYIICSILLVVSGVFGEGKPLQQYVIVFMTSLIFPAFILYKYVYLKDLKSIQK